MKDQAVTGIVKLLNRETLSEEELESVKMYFTVLFSNSSARYMFAEATTDNAVAVFEESILIDLNHIFTTRFGQ